MQPPRSFLIRSCPVLSWIAALSSLGLSALASREVRAQDWPRFRGVNGSGVVAAAARPLPTRWSPEQNLRWQVSLPGPGASSPIVVGEQVLVTAYSGCPDGEAEAPQQTGAEQRGSEDAKQDAGRGASAKLTRHLLSIDRATGAIRWRRDIPATLPEDPYAGFLREHGYASSTPVSDGKRVYAFFGKSGVHAFDLRGQPLWTRSVGRESGPQRWGSGASPIVWRDLVIVNAAEESESLVAFDAQTGAEAWRAEAAGLGGTWGTPVIAAAGPREELVIAVPHEIWGLDPRTGKFLWYAESIDTSAMCASLVTDDGIVYAVGGRQGGALAVRTGGQGNVTKTHVLWRARHQGQIASPVLYQGHLYWVSRGILNCVDAKSGKRVYRERLKQTELPSPRPPRSENYASPVIADGKLFVTARHGSVFVLDAQPRFAVEAENRVELRCQSYAATPAVSNGQLFLRAPQTLYCLELGAGRPE